MKIMLLMLMVRAKERASGFVLAVKVVWNRVRRRSMAAVLNDSRAL